MLLIVFMQIKKNDKHIGALLLFFLKVYLRFHCNSSSIRLSLVEKCLYRYYCIICYKLKYIEGRAV